MIPVVHISDLIVSLVVGLLLLTLSVCHLIGVEDSILLPSPEQDLGYAGSDHAVQG